MVLTARGSFGKDVLYQTGVLVTSLAVVGGLGYLLRGTLIDFVLVPIALKVLGRPAVQEVIAAFSRRGQGTAELEGEAPIQENNDVAKSLPSEPSEGDPGTPAHPGTEPQQEGNETTSPEPVSLNKVSNTGATMIEEPTKRSTPPTSRDLEVPASTSRCLPEEMNITPSLYNFEPSIITKVDSDAKITEHTVKQAESNLISDHVFERLAYPSPSYRGLAPFRKDGTKGNDALLDVEQGPAAKQPEQQKFNRNCDPALNVFPSSSKQQQMVDESTPPSLDNTSYATCTSSNLVSPNQDTVREDNVIDQLEQQREIEFSCNLVDARSLHQEYLDGNPMQSEQKEVEKIDGDLSFLPVRLNMKKAVDTRKREHENAVEALRKEQELLLVGSFIPGSMMSSCPASPASTISFKSVTPASDTLAIPLGLSFDGDEERNEDDSEKGETSTFAC